MATQILQEIYEFLQTDEGKNKFFTLIHNDKRECQFDSYSDDSSLTRSLDDIPQFYGCKLILKDRMIYISYTYSQIYIKSTGKIPNQCGMFYDSEDDVYYMVHTDPK